MNNRELLTATEVLQQRGNGVFSVTDTPGDIYKLFVCDGCLANPITRPTDLTEAKAELVDNYHKLLAQVYFNSGYIKQLEHGNLLAQQIEPDDTIWIGIERETEKVTAGVRIIINGSVIPSESKRILPSVKPLNLPRIMERLTELSERLSTDDLQILEATDTELEIAPDKLTNLLERFLAMEETKAFDEYKPGRKRSILRVLKKIWNGSPGEGILGLKGQDIQETIRQFYVSTENVPLQGLDFARFAIDPTAAKFGRGAEKHPTAAFLISQLHDGLLGSGQGLPSFVTHITLMHEALLEYGVSIMQGLYGPQSEIVCIPLGNASSGNINAMSLGSDIMASYFDNIIMWVLGRAKH